MRKSVSLLALNVSQIEEGMAILQAFSDKARTIHSATDRVTVQEEFHISMKEIEEKLAEIGLPAPWRKRWEHPVTEQVEQSAIVSAN